MSSAPSESNFVLENVDFERALYKYGSRKCFLTSLFLLCSSPGIINGFHMMAYVFYSSTPKHWCSIPVLENANWTADQIINISSPTPNRWSNCAYYERNYTSLSRMSYEEALQTINSEKKPRVANCKRFHYKMNRPGTSIVVEWNMVCDLLAEKATVQAALSVGKLLGALFFGSISDRFGRRVSFRIACLIYMIAGPLVAHGHFYQVMVIARVCLGIAAVAVYESAFSIVSETSPPNLRSTLGVMFNQSYPIGMVIIAVLGYFVRDWKDLQMLVSLLAFSLLFHIWVIPESPRWLYYSGRKEKAWEILQKFRPSEPREQRSNNEATNTINNTTVSPPETRHGICEQISSSVETNFEFLKSRELRRRLFICWYIWCSTATSYYALTISAGHLHLNPYLFVGLSGVVEVISYILAYAALKVIGRRNATSLLLIIAAICLLHLLVIPTTMQYCTLIVALLGRLCVSAVFCIAIIHAFELFPTVARSRAMSSSSTMAHFGSIFAPYLVDFFGAYAVWIPDAVCGVALLTASFVTQILPETRNIPLYNIIEDLETRSSSNPEERVSLQNCAPCSLYKKLKEWSTTSHS